MNDKSDIQLLHDYAECGCEAAFRELVVRHTDFVYSAALRQVNSSDIASDITQSVFADLARKSRSLAEKIQGESSLAGWLHRSTRYAALNHLRDTRRRLTNERLAMEQLITNSEALPDWDLIRPALDEALDSLDNEDREALLLRYFKNQDFRSVGRALGVSDDAAQKRVSRAVERLREFFTKRGVATGAGGLAAVISANAVQAAPAGLAITISTAATVAGTTIATTATKAIAMTTLQKIIITATLATVTGAGIYERHRATQLADQVQIMMQQRNSLVEQTQQLKRERDDAASRLTVLSDEVTRLNSNSSELLKLRGEVTRLKSANAAFVSDVADPAQSAAKSLLQLVSKLKQRLDETPEAKIPELQFLGPGDWIEATKGNLDTEADYRKAFSYLRDTSERIFVSRMQAALQKFLKANNDQFPTDLSQLKPFFENPPSDDILQRYQIVLADGVPWVSMFSKDAKGGESFIILKSVIDGENDAQYTLGRNGYSGATYQFTQAYSILAPAIHALIVATPSINNRVSFDIARLLPYLTTPEQKAAYYKLTNRKNPDSQ